MVKLSDLERNEGRAEVDKPIDQLFASVRMPRLEGVSQTFFCGWNEDGSVVVHSKPTLLRGNAPGDLETNRPIPFMYPAEMAHFTPKVIEFRAIAQPVDNQNTRRSFVQDLVTISGVDSTGEIKFVQIPELAILDGILKGQIISSIENATPYTLLLPDEANEALYFILFSPDQAWSNEFAYRTFILQVLGSLVDMDHNQVPPDQKGYIQAYVGAMESLEKKARGRGDYVSTGKELLAKGNVEQLRYVVGKFLEIATLIFEQGR